MRPNRATARRLAATWEVLRPIAILVSLAFAVGGEVLVAQLLTDGTSTAVAILVGVLLLLPLWFGTYMILSFPVNFLIGFARWEEEP